MSINASELEASLMKSIINNKPIDMTSIEAAIMKPINMTSIEANFQPTIKPKKKKPLYSANLAYPSMFQYKNSK